MTQSQQSVERPLAVVRPRSFLQKWEDFLYGYDFFISYRWQDGRDYAVALASCLRGPEPQEEFSVFLDSQEYAAGDDISWEGNRAVRKTSRLVLVASPGVADSAHVKRELQVYRTSGKRILTVDFGGSVQQLRKSDRQLASLLSTQELTVNERAEALTAGPSEAAVDKIRHSLLTELKRQRRQRAIGWAVATLLLLVAAALGAAATAKHYFDDWSARRYLVADLKAELNETSQGTLKVAVTTPLPAAIDGERFVDCCLTLGSVVQVDLTKQQLTAPAALGRLRDLRYLNLMNTSGIDSLDFVNRLPLLRELKLYGTGLNDGILQTLQTAGTLTELSLSKTQVTGSEIARVLNDNPELATLRLYGCENLLISDQLVARLKSHAANLKQNGRFLHLDIEKTRWASGDNSEFVRGVLNELRLNGHSIEAGVSERNPQSTTGGV